MSWSRFFMLLLVCTGVAILCIPCAASQHSSPSGGGSGGSDPGTAGASSLAPSDPAGTSLSAHTAGSGNSGTSAATGTAPAAGAGGGAEPGNSAQGGAAGDPGSPDGQGDSGRSTPSSPDTGQGPGSPQDYGTDDDSPPGPRYPEQDESSRKPESGITGELLSGSGEADGPGEKANRREGIGYQDGGEIRSPAGIIVFGAAGGIVRGSDIRIPPGQGDGAAGGQSREGAPQPPWHPSRDAAQKSVPPETAARIEQGNPESPSKPRSKREDESDEIQESCSRVPAASDPGSIPGSTLIFFFSLFGFRRIQKRNVLDNDCRRAVFKAIADTPGIDAVALSEQLDMNINTLRYHLAKLLATDKITYLSRPGTVRYYLNQGMFSPIEQLVLHYLRAGTAGRIIRLVSERQGLSRQDLAAALGISGPSVTRHIQQLSAEGIIRNEPDGRANHYFLTDVAALLLKKFQVTPTGSACRIPPAPV